MAEYIKRQDAIEEFENTDYDVFQREGDDGFSFATTIRVLHEIPAADVREVVRGTWKHVKWVKDEDFQEGGYWISRCSNCSMPYHNETPFCPHCGADMREATDET